MNVTRLKKRLVPKLLIKHRRMGTGVRPVLVTTRGYREALDVGDAVSQARIYEAQLADELTVLNIDGSPVAGDEVILNLIERLATETFMPLAVGGACAASTISPCCWRGVPTRCASTPRRWRRRN